MFNRNDTIVIANDQSDEMFRRFMTILSSYSEIKKVAENSDMGWMVIKLKTKHHKWQRLLSKLKNDMGITPYKVMGFWFI